MSVTYQKGQKDNRPWGSWEVIETGSEFIVKKITVFPHQKLSLQLHHYRSEHWIIVQGTGTVTVQEKTFEAPQNTAVFIPVEAIHRMSNETNEPVIFIEVQAGKTLDEEDIVRLEDSYNRV